MGHTRPTAGSLNTIRPDEEGGFVVHGANISRNDGTVIEVLVDAGSARIIAQESC